MFICHWPLVISSPLWYVICSFWSTVIGCRFSVIIGCSLVTGWQSKFICHQSMVVFQCLLFIGHHLVVIGCRASVFSHMLSIIFVFICHRLSFISSHLSNLPFYQFLVTKRCKLAYIVYHLRFKGIFENSLGPLWLVLLVIW